MKYSDARLRGILAAVTKVYTKNSFKTLMSQSSVLYTVEGICLFKAGNVFEILSQTLKNVEIGPGVRSKKDDDQ